MDKKLELFLYRVAVLLCTAAPLLLFADESDIELSEPLPPAYNKAYDELKYEIDGEPLNWRGKHTPGQKTSKECDEPNSEDKSCFKIDVDSLFNSKRWHKDKNLKSIVDVVADIESQVNAIGSGDSPYRSKTKIDRIPADYHPWWDKKVSKPLANVSGTVYESVNSLIERAIKHSVQIKVFSDVPIIRESAELEARGRFDPIAYIDARWTDLDEPVGSTLKTGGPDRFLEDEWLYKVGVKKKFITGGELDVSQQWGVLDNNSEFLEPKDQANARFAVTLTQPLLSGRGIKYNSSQIAVAKMDGSIALDEYKRQIESHLLELIRAYWGLYLERAALLQHRKRVNRTEKMVYAIKQRQDYDVSINQLRRVTSRLLDRKSEMVRAETSVRNAEAKILSLINDPQLRVNEQFEMVPTISPAMGTNIMAADFAIALALNNRPEINQAFKQVKAGSIRANMTKNELMPNLDLLVRYYRDGIAAEGDTGLAKDNAFDEGDGSWTVGLVFEYPIFNRTKKARHLRKKAEIRQLINQLKTTLETVVLEVQVSVREANTALRKMNSQFAALRSAQTEVYAMDQRKAIEVGDGTNGVVYLERLMEAQDRLTESEYEFLRSQIAYNIALANLDRATGMLLQTSEVQPRRYKDIDEYFKNLPTLKIEKVVDINE